jgi:hypothetical protein
MRRILLMIALVSLLPPHAFALTLGQYKDDLFAYPATLSQADGGAFVTVDYDEARDINQRDEIPERRVKSQYVTLAVRSAQKDLVADTAVGPVRHVAVGATSNATAITLYIHGQGGSRRQGVDDFTFGGNFNRIKMLMWKNGGLYLTPDFTEFGPKGVAQVAALIEYYLAKSPGAPVFVACGSMGGAICWGLANDKMIAPNLSGLLLLGSFPSNDFAGSLAAKRKVPLFLGQGSKDKVFPVETIEALYKKLRTANYPVQMVRFETGTHGTPIRMTDWRTTLNWMLSK